MTNRIFFDRKNPETEYLAEYLQNEGYIIGFQNETLKGSINFKWAGGLLKRRGSLELAPELSYMELGFMPHYDSLQLHPTGFCISPTKLLKCNKGKLDNFLQKYYPKDPKCDPAYYGILNKPYIVLFLQVLTDSVVRYNFKYNNSITNFYTDLIFEIKKQFPDHHLIVKEHPKCPTKLKSRNSMTVIQKETSQDFIAFLIKKASYVFTINSSIVIECLVNRTPCITFGSGIFTGYGVVKEATSFENLANFPFIKNPDDFLYTVLIGGQIIIGEDPSIAWRKFTDEYEAVYNNT